MPLLELEETTIPYEIRRSRRARQIRIIVRGGSVTVVAPWFVRGKVITSLVESKHDWIRRKAKAQRNCGPSALPEAFVDGARLLYRNRRLRIHVTTSDRRSATLRFSNGFHVAVPEHLREPEGEEVTRRLITDWCKRRALNDARRWIVQYSRDLGRQPSSLRIGNQKTLWGSCSARGTISLNWRLVSAPSKVFEYVVVHELCHLIERNHGKAFWRLVESLLPDYAERRAWLKKHGVKLG